MQAVSASEWLRVWEEGLNQSPPERALTMLAAACPEATWEDLARLSIGQRDARLLALRELAFGSTMAGLAACPACGEQLEFDLNAADILTGPSREQEPGCGEVAGYRVQFRLPDSLDLLAAATQGTSTPSGARDSAARGLLLERCLLSVSENGEEVAVDQLPAEVAEAVGNWIAQADPQADVQLDLNCPACLHRWQAVFDIAAFFWNELDAWAYRILRQVHVLASAYGWREADILALSPWRRQCYLEMVSG
jgi:hypothetical protein